MNKCYNSVDLAEAVSSDLWSGSEDPVGADGTIKGVEEAAGASEGSTGGVAGAVTLLPCPIMIVLVTEDVDYKRI